jgi:uncharacterized protein YoxC
MIEISVAIIALAFVILVIFLILTLISLRKTLDDLKEKSQKLDGLFNTIGHVGDYLDKSTEPLEQCDSLYELCHETEEKDIDWVGLAAAGLLIWHKLQKRR